MKIMLFFPGRIRTYETGFSPMGSFEGEELLAERNLGDGTLTLYVRAGFSNRLEDRAALRKQLPGNYTLEEVANGARAAAHALSHGGGYSSRPSSRQDGSSSAKMLGEVMTVKDRGTDARTPTIADACRLAHEQFGLLRLDLDGETLWEVTGKDDDFDY